MTQEEQRGSSFCSIHGMPTGECFDLHQPEPLTPAMVERRAETVEEMHHRIQEEHRINGHCKACDPAKKDQVTFT